MSLYGDYIKEREGYEIVETTLGFATYVTGGQECYIRDVFVKPAHRNNKIASTMIDEVAKIAKEKGCKFIITSVSTYANSSRESTLAILAYGFKPYKSDSQLVYFLKELI